MKRCSGPDGAETFILCRSRDRREKEKAMHERFEKRIEKGLEKIALSCQRRRQDPVRIGRRIGALLAVNSRAAGLFDVDVKAEESGRAKIAWKKVDAWRDWAALSEGCYLLRSNVTDWSAEELWRAYIQLTEAEAAFRIHKSDLWLRPIWHQKEERVQAHILVCFLAYVLWKTLGQLCRRAGIGDEPRRVFDELAQIRVVDVVLPTQARSGHPQALRHTPHRPPGDPAATARPSSAFAHQIDVNVVKTFGAPSLKHSDLRQQLRKLGEDIDRLSRE